MSDCISYYFMGYRNGIHYGGGDDFYKYFCVSRKVVGNFGFFQCNGNSFLLVASLLGQRGWNEGYRSPQFLQVRVVDLGQ